MTSKNYKNNYYACLSKLLSLRRMNSNDLPITSDRMKELIGERATVEMVVEVLEEMYSYSIIYKAYNSDMVFTGYDFY